MRLIILSVFCGISILSFSQKVMPLLDFNGFFKSFENGFFRQIELQRIQEFKAGDDVVGYVDNRGNLRVYNGGKQMDLSNMAVEYEVSDRLLTWKIGQTLNMWDNGSKRTLTFNVRNYWVKDSIVVFEDTRYGSVNVYYSGEVYPLYTSIGEFSSPDFVGENIVAFRDNGNFNKVFWRGKIYDLDVWHNPFVYEAGTDVVAFNDPINGTFAIFENGEFLDVESFHVPKYKAGRGFVVYENRNGDLMYYGNGVKKQLTNFGARDWVVKDDVVMWSENGYMYAFVLGQKTEVSRYIPQDYKIKNDVVAFRNIMGGVSIMMNGKVEDITNQMNSEYEIFGSSVLVSLFNNSFIVWQNGRKYTY